MGAGISKWQARKLRALEKTMPPRPSKFGSAVLRRHYVLLADEINKAMRAITKGKDSQQLLKLNLERIFEISTRLDPYRLSKEDERKLTEAIYVNLPRTVEASCSDAYEEGSWSDVWEMRDYEYTSVHSTVAAIVRAQMDPDYLRSQALNVAAIEEEPAQEVAEVASFPQLRKLTAEIDAKVEELARLWAAANALQVSVEDRYLLDQIAARYLPDTWQMLDSYGLLPDELRKAADSMVSDQLQILTHQISEIHRRAAGNSLDNLRTQTEFIRAQHEQRRGSKLTLDSEQG